MPLLNGEDLNEAFEEGVDDVDDNGDQEGDHHVVVAGLDLRQPVGDSETSAKD